MKIIANYRYDSDSFFASDRYKYGDLFGFSYLKDFKIPPGPRPVIISHCPEPKSINLYMLCDSYLWSFVKTDSIFCGVNKLKYVRWKYGEQLDEELDTNKKNVLIIEMSERFVRKLGLDSLEMYNSMKAHKPNIQVRGYREPKTTLEKAINYLFNPLINENLEFNLFDYRFLTPIRELKSELNYWLFDRVDKDVALSTDKKNLFYKETVDTTLVSSSFKYIDDEEIARLVSALNLGYSHFIRLGFNEIYLSLIPNPVTIADPAMGKYNGLINKIQRNPDLKLKVIDIYTIFKGSGSALYSRSDTHWNSAGFQLWVNEVNRIFKRDLLK